MISVPIGGYMVTITGFTLHNSGNASVAISDTWKPGIDAVQRKVEVIRSALEKREHHEKGPLSRIEEMVNKQLSVLSRNLPPMLRLRDAMNALGEEALASQVTPHIQRVQSLKSDLTDLKKLIETRLSA